MRSERSTTDWHLTGDLLREVEQGAVDLEACMTLLVEHLHELCPTCGAGLKTYAAGDHQESASAGTTFLTDAFIDRAAAMALDFAGIEARAREAHDDLLRLPSHADRLAAIERGGDRYVNPALVEILLDRSRAGIHAAAAEAQEAAELAVEVARRLTEGPYGRDFCRDLLAEARAHQANALRSRGELRAAEGLLREAQELAAGSCDPFLRAEVASLAASLAKDQRRWSLAHEKLDEAERGYLEVDAGLECIVKVQLKRAEVAFLSGATPDALHRIREVIACTDAGAIPDLHFIAEHNLAGYLCEEGDYHGAAALTAKNEPLYRRHPDGSVRARHRWLRGKIAQGLGDSRTAEREYHAARDALLALGMGYSAALVALDLATLYLEQGRTAEVREIALWTTTLFETQDIHREALAAFSLFRQASLEDALTVAQLRLLARHVATLHSGAGAATEPMS